MNVSYNVDPKSAHAMDIGKKRTPSDSLAVKGVRNAIPIAAGIGMYLHMKHVKEATSDNTAGGYKFKATSDIIDHEYFFSA